jgi:phosphoribosyl 1,2-cyclic phosphodiesterase
MIEFKSYFSSSAGNLHTCSDGDTTIFLDLGVPFGQAKKAVSFTTSSLSGALITHSHKDHCKGVSSAIKMGLDCYLLPETIKELKISGHRIHRVDPMKIFKIGSLNILPFPLQHDVPIVGFLIESDSGGKMVYITDTYFCKFRFKNVNIFAVECNYSVKILEENIRSGAVPKEIRNRIVKSHFSLENVKEFFRVNDTSKTDEIHLIHLSGNNADPGLFKSEIQAVTGKPVFAWPE